MNERRRRLLVLIGTIGVAGLTGCVESDGEKRVTEASAADSPGDTTKTTADTVTPTPTSTATVTMTPQTTSVVRSTTTPSSNETSQIPKSTNWQAKLGPGVDAALTDVSDSNQDRIPVIIVASSEAHLGSLEEAVENADGQEIRVLRSVPGVSARLTPSAVRSLAQRSDVSRIEYNRRVSKD